MSKLLDIESRIQNRKQQDPPSIKLSPDQMEVLQSRNNKGSSIRPPEKVRYLPIVGVVCRDGTNNALPLIPIQFEGAYYMGDRIRVEERIFERRSDGKGHFMLLVRYEPKDEKRIEQGEIRLSVGGQSRIFRIPITMYHQEGKRAMQDLLGTEKFKGAFHRLGINEYQITSKNQLTQIAIAKITIH
ncbi:MAG: hypothetical protein ACFHU9_03975 [Fluviicola sp.]